MSYTNEFKEIIKQDVWGYFVGDQTPEKFMEAYSDDSYGLARIETAVMNYINDMFEGEYPSNKATIKEGLVDYLLNYYNKSKD